LTVLLTLLAFDAYMRWRNSSALFIFAAALGLAMSAKFLAVILVPVLALCDLVHYHAAFSWQGDRERRAYRPLLGWIMATAGLVCFTMSAAQGHQVPLSIVLWAAGVVSLLLTAVQLLTQRAVRWPPLAAWLAILLLATTVCLAAFPAHVLQPGVLQQMLNRTSHWDGRQPLTLLGEHLRLYSGILLLKLGVPLGVLSVAALGWACLRAWRHTGLRWMVAVLGIYIVMLVTLPLRQTFYLMSIYPLLILIVSGFLVEMTAALHPWSILQRVWIGTVIAAHLWLLWGVVQVYPEFGWYGYETIGERWLGEESRGYRNIIQITNDGTEDALYWSVAHVPAGARMVSYLSAYHIVEAFVASHTLPFELIQRHGDIDTTRALRSGEANYFLVDLNTLIDRGLPLRGEGPWGPPVHTIWRGRGRYRIPVVHVYSQPTPTYRGNQRDPAITHIAAHLCLSSSLFPGHWPHVSSSLHRSKILSRNVAPERWLALGFFPQADFYVP
jgi:hypothetical protein